MNRPPRVFLLSPARLDGARAQQLFAPKTDFALARDLRQRDGVPIGDVYRFLSSLYFRGKLAYARRFARPPVEPDEGGDATSWLGSGVLVITPTRGLLPDSARVCLEHLEEFREVDIDAAEPRFRKPLVRDAALLRDALAPEPDAEVVLLGSLASPKYTDPLRQALGPRLRFPRDLVGRGDMSRGGLLLRCVESGAELSYESFETAGAAVLRGARPPKLGAKTPRK